MTVTLATVEPRSDRSHLVGVGAAPRGVSGVGAEFAGAVLGVERLDHRPGEVAVHRVVGAMPAAAYRLRDEVLDAGGWHHHRFHPGGLGLLDRRVVGAPEHEVLIEPADALPQIAGHHEAP